jgi:hypothetical protein
MELVMDGLTVDLPAFTLTIPSWVFLLLPAIAGAICFWLAGKAEAIGIRLLSHPETVRSGEVTYDAWDAHPYFERMGRLRVGGYLMLLLFIVMALQIFTVPAAPKVDVEHPAITSTWMYPTHLDVEGILEDGGWVEIPITYHGHHGTARFRKVDAE